MDDEELIKPDHTDVPEDDNAEPDDAEVEHLATEEEVQDYYEEGSS